MKQIFIFLLNYFTHNENVRKYKIEKIKQIIIKYKKSKTKNGTGSGICMKNEAWKKRKNENEKEKRMRISLQGYLQAKRLLQPILLLWKNMIHLLTLRDASEPDPGNSDREKLKRSRGAARPTLAISTIGKDL